MNSTQEELIDTVALVKKNSFLTARIYAQQNPGRRDPHPTAFKILNERFNRTGKVDYKTTRTHDKSQQLIKKCQMCLSVAYPHKSFYQIDPELYLSA